MAKIGQGILGPFSGKVGTVIGSSWNGIPYIKSKATTFHDAKTPAQLAHRLKLQVAHGFVKSVKTYAEIGFRKVSGNQTPYNRAVSCIMKQAIVGEYPTLYIEPSKVVLSQGKLAGAEECLATKEKDKKISFSWSMTSSSAENGTTDEINVLDGVEDDTAWLIAYNFTKQEVKALQANRKDQKDILEYPNRWKGDKIGCYIFFASNETDDTSDSQFLGTI